MGKKQERKEGSKPPAGAAKKGRKRKTISSEPDCSKETQEIPDWESLPALALQKVFDQLSLKSLAAAACVCRTWNQESQDDRSVSDIVQIFNLPFLSYQKGSNIHCKIGVPLVQLILGVSIMCFVLCGHIHKDEEV